MEALVLGLGLLIIALFLSLFLIRPSVEGFQVGSEPGTTVATCSTLTNCKACAGAKNCGWCSNIEKCIEVNRMGEPILNACPTTKYVRLPEQCEKATPTMDTAAGATTPVPAASTGTTGSAAPAAQVAGPEQTTSTVVLPTYEIRPCTSTDQVIEAAKKRLSDTVKALVRNEMRLYNVPLTEGFTVEDDISKVVVYSIQDDVKKMVKDSVEKARSTTSTPQ